MPALGCRFSDPASALSARRPGASNKFAVTRGETWLLSAPSGAGKNDGFPIAACGFHDPHHCAVRIDGGSICALPIRQRCAKRIGTSTQDPVIFEPNAWENIGLLQTVALQSRRLRRRREAGAMRPSLSLMPCHALRLPFPRREGVRLSGGANVSALRSPAPFCATPARSWLLARRRARSMPNRSPAVSARSPPYCGAPHCHRHRLRYCATGRPESSS